MFRRKTKYLLLIPMFATPLFTLASCKYKNYVDGAINDLENNNDNNSHSVYLDNKIISSTEKPINLYKEYVSTEITFKDYNLPSIDPNDNTYKYIKDRGGLVDKKVSSDIKINKDDYLSRFNWKSFILNNSQLSEPNENKFFDDFNYGIFKQWIINEKSFSIEDVSLSNFLFDTNTNKISFEYKLNLIFDSTTNSITLFEHKFDNLISNTKIPLTISANNSTIQNIINNVKNRFYLNWSLSNVSIQLGTNPIITSNDFVWLNNSPSFAYPVEFYNLVENEINNNQNAVDSNTYMNSLTKETIQKDLLAQIKLNTESNYKIGKNFGDLIKIISTNPTLGELLYQSSFEIESILTELNIFNSEIRSFISALLQQFHTGEGVLTFLEKNKLVLAQIGNYFLKDVIGDVTGVLEIVLSNFKPDMSEDDKNGIIDLIKNAIPDEVLRTKVVNVLNKLFKNPFSLDLVKVVLNELGNEIKAALINVGIQDDGYNAIINILTSFVQRALLSNDSSTTDLSSGNVVYQNKIFDIILSSQTVKNELFNNIKIILKNFNIDLDDNTNVLYDVINQVITKGFVENNNINVPNVIGALDEISNFILFITNPLNLKNQISFVKDIEFNFDSKENKNYLDFNLLNEIIFLKDYLFDFSKIFNLSNTNGGNGIKITINVNGLPIQIAINLKNILRFIPNSIKLFSGDKLVFNYTPIENKIIYNQFYNNENIYNGYSFLVNRQQYIEQANVDNGFLSSWLNLLDNNLKKNSAKNLLQSFLINNFNSTFWIDGFDENSPSKYIFNNSYYEGYTFKWNDLDIYHDIFNNVSTPTNSQFEMLLNSIDDSVVDTENVVNYIEKGFAGSSNIVSLNRNNYSIPTDQLNNLKNTFVTLGSKLNDSNNIIFSIKPMFKLKQFDIVFNSILFPKITIDLFAYSVDFGIPFKILDLSNVQRNNDTYTLSNYNFSNRFKKIIFGISAKLGFKK